MWTQLQLPSISDQDVSSYQRDGVVCLHGMFGADWIDRLREATDAAMANPGPHAEDYTPAGGPGRYVGDLELWQRHATFRRFVFESPAAEIAGRIMQSGKVNFFYDQLLVKEPGTRERTPWHQDQPYWAIDGWQVCSLWLPLDPVDRTVCVEYVAGSHRWGQAYNPEHFKDGTPYADTGLPKLPDIDSERARHRILSWDMQPGDCLLFQAMIAHGSQGNQSPDRRRRALSTRWAGDDARYCRRAGEVGFPTSDPGLEHGAVMDSPAFPVVWRARDATVT